MRVGSFAVFRFPVKGCRILRLLRAGKPLPLLLVLLAVGVLPAGASAAPAPLFTFRDPQIAESSGIVASATRDDVVFTHNDSGDTARFFAVDRYGCTVGVFTAPGVAATDWEDMARGPGRSLWLGDIGDNNAERDEIAVQRFDEPAVGASTDGSGCPPAAEQAVTAASYRLRFEDGPHDAETLLVDPRTSQVFIITKSFAAGALYAAPNPLKTDDVNVLRKVADVGAPAFATGGDIAPDGKSVAVRNYWEIDIRTIPDGNLATAFAAWRARSAPRCTRQRQAGRGTGFHPHGPRLADVLRRRERAGLPDPTGERRSDQHADEHHFRPGHHGGRYDGASRDGGDAQPPEVPGGVAWAERGGRCRCGHKGQLYAL